jgi:hypothetical protein
VYIVAPLPKDELPPALPLLAPVTPPVPPEPTITGTVAGKSLAVINFQTIDPPPPPEPGLFWVDVAAAGALPPPPPPPTHTTYTNLANAGFVQVPLLVNV